MTSVAASKADSFRRRHRHGGQVTGGMAPKTSKAYRNGAFLLLFLVFIFWQEASAPLSSIRNSPVRLPKTRRALQDWTPPVPSSDHAVQHVAQGSRGGTSEDASTTYTQPAPGATVALGEDCLTVLSAMTCQVRNLTACVQHNANATQEAFLIIENGGEIPLRVNVSFLPANISIDEIQIDKQQRTKVDIPTNVTGNYSIILNTGRENCSLNTSFPLPLPPLAGADESSAATGKNCSVLSETCQAKNVTACLHYNATKQAFLLLNYSGETPLGVNITFLPANITLNETKLLKQKQTEVDVTDFVGGSSSITLSAGDYVCVINMRSKSMPPAQFAFGTHVGILLSVVLILTAVFTVACRRLWKRGGKVGEVPYQNLEMGMENSISAKDFGTAKGWDQSWGDDNDWDAVRTMKPQSSLQKRNSTPNGPKGD